MSDRKSVSIPAFASGIKGFLAADEGLRLFELALEACALGPCLEIGSFCGKSTVYLGTACKMQGRTLFTIDHHRGNEEQQPGQPYFDAELLDASTGTLDSFPYLRATIQRAELDDVVVPMVTTSEAAARDWATPLGMVFIDGGHSYETVLTDYQCWYPHLLPGGYLAFHDIYPDPSKGGQAPYEVYKQALASGLFEEMPMTDSLGVLQRRRPVVVKKQVRR
ncbi:MAG: class I SAM-dependent methyltransferase [Chloroflexi bacterium]|nr:class I SAM-dependent methyltransferase [Chloroflexota bacterium]MBM3154805.1 class I SAM-dependent methyltransferase [Chloroflexota bacterium]MBM3172344.1 class I SAM-dependent methyltransferase [Chloroflexota bacterium]MBM3175963.1 class I SAM-dependent methyltransferase [Chloroflexota bacterium]MBM4451392.1 class I SAM-dependent methyltransferase [Chloroflexota bacterium]